MGNEGDFTIDNVNNDPWPWFSHQHEVGIEGNGTGAMSMLDNGNSRIAPPPLGLGPSPACLPYDCNSRGMAVNFSETSMIVTPQVAIDLGYFSSAMGSAQLLPNGDYFFLASIVVLGLNSVVSNALEYPPSPAFDIGTQYLNLQGPESYRAWRMPSMYDPPIT
jgi:hypothetical protein